MSSEGKSECKRTDDAKVAEAAAAGDRKLTALDEVMILDQAIETGYFGESPPYRFRTADRKFAVYIAELGPAIVTYIRSREVMKFEHQDLFEAGENCHKWLEIEAAAGRISADVVGHWVTDWNEHLLEMAEAYEGALGADAGVADAVAAHGAATASG